jgi:hypothetical protein
MEKAKKFSLMASVLLAIMLVCTILAVPSSVMCLNQGRWWETVPEEEVTSPYYDSIPYWQIAPTLRDIELKSNRVRVEVIGQSAGGRNLFLVTVSSPEAFGRLGRYQALRQLMVKDPEKAQEMIDQFEDFKVPVYIHASIHGTEYPGVDAAIELIKTLAFEDTEEVRMILDNVILLVNVVANPDGRVLGTRSNALGFDLNRDFITQSQPETRAAVSVITQWNPMVVLDLHGFSSPMLIEPCTPPHNPNYEYDLYIKWALAQAMAMEAELKARTGWSAQIPFRDRRQGWDDWPPIFTPMYAIYHGAYGHTLETPYRDHRGVEAHYWAVWGALKFVSQNRKEMIRDQIEAFRRGFLDLPQLPIPEEILKQTQYEQYNYLTVIDFPAAYVIPKDAPLQQNPHQAARLVNFLIFNDIQVEQATTPFTLNGVTYPKGTYIVWMNQPKRGLANTILWDGWDISYVPGLAMYDISGWSHPLLWGVTRAITEEEINVKTCVVNRADAPKGFVESGQAKAYAYLPTCNEAIKATNELLSLGITIYRAKTSFTDSGRTFNTGTFIIPVNQANVKAVVNELANKYGLSIYALKAVPNDVSLMRKQRIAVHADEGVRFFLKEYGFDYTIVTTSDLNAGIDLSGYDIFIHSGWSYLWNSLTSTGKATLTNFFANGGNYIGIGRSGIHLNVQARLLSVSYKLGLSDDNGILKVTYMPSDSISAQYLIDSYAFVYGPVWFTAYDGLEVSAYIKEGEFFVSGMWRDWKTSGAAGKPVIVHGVKGSSIITLMGINPTFRAHPEHTFLLLANAIYNALG